MPNNDRTVCIIVPAYNEAAAIVRTVADLVSHRPGDVVVVVNDCSTDDTESLARETTATVLSLPYNLGIGGAVQTGLKYALEAGHRVAVQFDGDGQHLAEEINTIVEPVRAGEADVVIGSRFIGKTSYKPPLFRRLGIAVLGLTNRLLTGQPIADNTSGFRACNREALTFLAEFYPQDYPEPQAVVELIKNGFRVIEVPVCMRERQTGGSSIGALSSIYYMTKVLLSNVVASSRRPVDRKG